MMIRLLSIFLLLCASAVPGFKAQAAVKAPVWEVVTITDYQPGTSDAEHLQVETRDGYIYITIERPAEVEVYTILGQLVTRRKLQPGTTRLQLGMRGIYILKSGASTRRVNL